MQRDSKGRFIKGDKSLGGWNKGLKGYTNAGSFKKGESREPWNKGKKGVTNAGSFTKGNTRGLATRFKVGENTGEDNPNWAGDDIGYHGVHDWVKRELGKPDTCQNCGLQHNKCHWHNISKEYKRDVTDWIRLCPSCHRKVELTNA